MDWNGDGIADTFDGWVELFNAGTGAVDLSGWQLSEVSPSRSRSFALQPGTGISGHSYLILFNRETRLEPERAAGELRLLYPNGDRADTASWAGLRDDQSLARSRDGIGDWTADCVPSPRGMNCQETATLTGSFNLPYFRQHIGKPFQWASADVAVLATNLLLALVLALAMGFFGNLLNDAVESHEERLLKLFAPVRAVMWRVNRITGRMLGISKYSSILTGLSFLAGLAVLLAVYGLVLAFLDPSFDPMDRDGWLLILALALSAGLVSLSDDIAQYLYLHWRGHRAVIRIHGGNMLLVVLTTVVSRFSGLAPGLLVGSPAGIEEVDDSSSEARLHLLGLGAIAAVASLAGVLTMLLDTDAWLETLFLLIFAAGVQTLFFEMLPLKYLHGRGVFHLNRVLWLLIFVVTTSVFLGTMLNPDGAFISAFQSPNMTILAIFVIAFCVFSTGLWFFLQSQEKAEASSTAE